MTMNSNLVLYAAAFLGAVPQTAFAQTSGSDGARIVFDIDARLFYGDKKGTGDFEDGGRSGYRVGGRLGVDYESGSNEFSLDLGSALIEYFDKDQRDRWSNTIAVAYGRTLGGDLKLSTAASYGTQLIGLEFDKFNQAQARGGLIYEPGNDRFRIGGGYRWRRYDDVGSTHGHGYFIDADYRRKLGDRQSVGLDVTYDRIKADVNSRDYKRFTITPSYRMGLGDKLDLELSARWRSWTYDNRLIGTSRRHDKSLEPMARLTYGVAKDLDLYAEAGWRRRWSKDPAAVENGPRGTIGISYRFRIDD